MRIARISRGDVPADAAAGRCHRPGRRRACSCGPTSAASASIWPCCREGFDGKVPDFAVIGAHPDGRCRSVAGGDGARRVPRWRYLCHGCGCSRNDRGRCKVEGAALHATRTGTAALAPASTSRWNTGERVAILGPNGAGKTTLMLHLNGVLTATDRACHRNRAGRREGHTGRHRAGHSSPRRPGVPGSRRPVVHADGRAGRCVRAGRTSAYSGDGTRRACSATRLMVVSLSDQADRKPRAPLREGSAGAPRWQRCWPAIPRSWCSTSRRPISIQSRVANSPTP